MDAITQDAIVHVIEATMKVKDPYTVQHQQSVHIAAHKIILAIALRPGSLSWSSL